MTGAEFELTRGRPRRRWLLFQNARLNVVGWAALVAASLASAAACAGLATLAGGRWWIGAILGFPVVVLVLLALDRRRTRRSHVGFGWTDDVVQVEEAAELASGADVAVIVARSYEAEGDDRPHMTLPSGQQAVVKAVLATGTPTIVVLMTGSPIDTVNWGGQPAALLQAWFPGQAQGDALARVLTGAAEPGGRLPLTIPASIDDTPAADPRTYPGVDGNVHYDEGVFVGYRAVTADGPAPAYHFGHGLTYTTFAYSDLEVLPDDGDNVATVAVTVTNTGEREGSEVAQVYVGALPVPVETPERQLAGFAKVTLAPGASQRVEVAVPRRAVSYFDADAHDWVSASGEVVLLVGASSNDVRLSGSVVV